MLLQKSQWFPSALCGSGLYPVVGPEGAVVMVEAAKPETVLGSWGCLQKEPGFWIHRERVQHPVVTYCSGTELLI